MSTAYEAITSRLALPTAEAIEQYDAAQIDTAGLIAKADGTRPFIGVVQYGAEAAGNMATVVKGIFPVKVSAKVLKGARVKVDGVKAGKFVTADAADDAVGIALMDIDVSTTGSILMIDSAGA